MIEAVIFDMDGILVDDFEPWLEFDRKFLSKFGLSPDNEYIRFVNGRSEEEVVRWLIEKYYLPFSEQEIYQMRSEEISRIYKEHARPMPGARNLLDKIKQGGYNLALASGAKLWQIEVVLKRFQWEGCFDAVVSSDHVGYKGKPDPEIYLHTARLLKRKPADCVVFEDAENGLISAKAAGMKCIAVLDRHWSMGDFSKADLVVESLEAPQITDYLGL